MVVQGSHSLTPVKSGDVQLLEARDTNPLQGPGQSPSQEKLGWRRLVSGTPEFQDTGRQSLHSPGVWEGKATSERKGGRSGERVRVAVLAASWQGVVTIVPAVPQVLLSRASMHGSVGIQGMQRRAPHLSTSGCQDRDTGPISTGTPQGAGVSTGGRVGCPGLWPAGFLEMGGCPWIQEKCLALLSHWIC